MAVEERMQWYKQQRKKALKNAFKDHCSIEENYSFVQFSKLWMAFYTVKAVICLLLHRSKGTDESVAVAMWDYWEGGYFEPNNGWQELQVGYGVFQVWYYQIISNSNY